jgi:hypothetical protein
MKARIIYIIGKGRSGSTFLGDFLGSLPDVFHAGELDNLWRYNLLEGSQCSCRTPLQKCTIWKAILNTARTDERCAWAFANPTRMLSLQQNWLSFRGYISSKLTKRDPKKYLETMDGVYEAIYQVTKKSVIVDSSKWPLNPRVSYPLKPPNAEVIHVMRNPWSVANSWEGAKQMPDSGTNMPQYGKVHSSLSWSARVIVSEGVRRSLGAAGHKVHFEDISRAPEEALVKLCQSLMLSGAEQLIENDSAYLAQSHAVFGNPSRFQTGKVKFREDLAMNQPKSRLVTVLTSPVRWMVGY